MVAPCLYKNSIGSVRQGGRSEHYLSNPLSDLTLHRMVTPYTLNVIPVWSCKIYGSFLSDDCHYDA